MADITLKENNLKLYLSLYELSRYFTFDIIHTVVLIRYISNKLNISNQHNGMDNIKFIASQAKHIYQYKSLRIIVVFDGHF
jgi:hypothetical protein